MLHGRAAELADIRSMLADARAGHSSAQVIVGAAGSGKTALLDHVAADATGFHTMRCTGVESEAELPFAALHQLLHDRVEGLEALPAPQAAALRAAFGLAAAADRDRFLTGLATLSLLSEIAGDGPVLCLIDDVQWLDRASLDALLFAGRRLGAEGVVLLLAAREDPPLDFRGLPMLALRALSESAAAALLAERAPNIAPDTRDQVLAEADGNPLALIELAEAVGADHSPAVGPPTVSTEASAAGRRVLDLFGARLDRMPSGTRLALLVAAVEGTGELGVVLAAVERIGLQLKDFEPAERVRLVQLSSTAIAFRHPLVRSAAYERAPAADRLRCHRAVAEALSAPEYADRRAWHLAAATIGFDDDVADALEAAAARADQRGGYAASAAAHERAARLTTDPGVRGQRLAAAAQSARDSAQLDRAARLAAEAAALPTDTPARARLDWVRARVEFERGTPRRASEMVLDGAVILADLDAERAAKMVIESGRMAYFADEAPALGRLVEMIEQIRLPPEHPLRPLLAATSTVAMLQTGAPADRIPPLAPFVHAIQPGRLGVTIGNLPIQCAFLHLLIGDVDEAMAQSARMLAEARDRGMIGGLPHILLNHAQAALVAGRLSEAHDAADEGIRIAEDTGQRHSATNLRGVLARIAALTGDEDRCSALAHEAIHLGAQRHLSSVGSALLALAVLDLGFGRYQAALERLQSVPPRLQRHPVFAYLAAPEWAEAASRSGHPELAASALRRLERWAPHRDAPVAAAELHRCRALLSTDDQAEQHFRTALSHYRELNRPMAQARTELLYGEWLRRVRRRAESREPLRAAVGAFAELGARSWAERARSELRATGETVAAPDDATTATALLTPQELQVVRLAAAGLSNRDIGAQLFLSPRTVGYHLYKAFPKLGVAARHELAALDLS